MSMTVMTAIALDDAQHRCGRPLSLDGDSRRGGLKARRNVLFGLWAARRLGLDPGHREAYAWSVHFADGAEPGARDVLGKVAADFAEAGVEMPARHLRHQLREMELRAFLQLALAETRIGSRSRARR
jgi:hypothetical protein